MFGRTLFFGLRPQIESNLAKRRRVFEVLRRHQPHFKRRNLVEDQQLQVTKHLGSTTWVCTSTFFVIYFLMSFHEVTWAPLTTRYAVVLGQLFCRCYCALVIFISYLSKHCYTVIVSNKLYLFFCLSRGTEYHETYKLAKQVSRLFYRQPSESLHASRNQCHEIEMLLKSSRAVEFSSPSWNIRQSLLLTRLLTSLKRDAWHDSYFN